MWEIEKDFTFQAAHQLPLHDGKCARPHGHSYRLRVVLQGDSLQINGPKSGMLVDYSYISNIVTPLITQFLDHHDLNKTLHVPHTTSELIAQWVYQYLETSIPELAYVEIQETDTCRCRYYGKCK